MVKRYINLTISYGVIAMILGVFYREFTKFSHFGGQTSLSLLHTHYFLLGMFFFLVLMLAEKAFSFSSRNTGKILTAYQIGLNITGLGFLLRGLTQVLAQPGDGRLHLRNRRNWAYPDGGLYRFAAAANQETGSLTCALFNTYIDGGDGKWLFT